MVMQDNTATALLGDSLPTSFNVNDWNVKRMEMYPKIGVFDDLYIIGNIDSIVPIPEPTTILLAMFGLTSVCCWRRRR